MDKILKTISEKVVNEYLDEMGWAEEEGVSSCAVCGYAYSAAKKLALKEGGIAEYLDSPYEGDYPTIIYTFADGSSCELSYGGCYTIVN